jgi:hypothetical protein
VWLRQRSTFGRLEKVYAIVILLGVIGTVFLGVTAQDRGMLVAALASAAYTYARSVRIVSIEVRSVEHAA